MSFPKFFRTPTDEELRTAEDTYSNMHLKLHCPYQVENTLISAQAEFQNEARGKSKICISKDEYDSFIKEYGLIKCESHPLGFTCVKVYKKP